MIDQNNVLSKALEAGISITLEFGCGPVRSIPGAITLDRLNMPSVDIQCDLEEGLPFIPDGSVDRIHSSHFLEHVNNFGNLMAESFRVLKPNGRFTGVVPHFSNPCFYSDYTHKNSFGLYTFSYFSKSDYFSWIGDRTYNSVDFSIEKIALRFKSPVPWLNSFKKYAERIINAKKSRQEFYEGNLSGILHASELHFELRK